MIDLAIRRVFIDGVKIAKFNDADSNPRHYVFDVHPIDDEQYFVPFYLNYDHRDVRQTTTLGFSQARPSSLTCHAGKQILEPRASRSQNASTARLIDDTAILQGSHSNPQLLDHSGVIA